MSKRWTLVTGASGFIGSRLVRLLIERGERVKGFVRAGASLAALQGLPEERFALAYGDITVEHTVYRALAGCDRLFHVASNFEWWSPRPELVLEPARVGTRAVLSAAARRGVERVVVTSSAVVLGASDAAQPMDEDHAWNLADPELYALAKKQAHDIALEFVEEGCPIVIVMPSMAVGPGDRRPTPAGRLIVKYLNSNARPDIMDGGVNVVDVDDVALGHALAMERGQVGESYILGGDDTTYEELYGALSEITGLAPPGARRGRGTLELMGRLLELKARLFGGAPVLTARMARCYAGRYTWVNSDKAEQDLGYTHRPQLEALRRSVRWFVDNGYVRDPLARRLRLELRTAEV